MNIEFGIEDTYDFYLLNYYKSWLQTKDRKDYTQKDFIIFLGRLFHQVLLEKKVDEATDQVMEAIKPEARERFKDDVRKCVSSTLVFYVEKMMTIEEHNDWKKYVDEQFAKSKSQR